jgi:hypothetical protein
MSNPTLTRTDKVWAGRWLMAVALLHTIAAGMLFGDPLLDIVRSGVFNGIGRDPLKAAAVWFLLFGAVLALCSMALTPLEAQGDARTLRSIGAGMLMLTILGVVLMPASGFWLAFPPAIALLFKRGAGAASAPLQTA